MTDPSHSETLTPQEMSEWLFQELADVNKARDLRVKQATALVESYRSGEFSPEQTAQAFFEYDMRWGDALFGVHTSPGASDDEILKAVDEKRKQSNHVAKTRASKSSNSKPFL